METRKKEKRWPDRRGRVECVTKRREASMEDKKSGPRSPWKKGKASRGPRVENSCADTFNPLT